MPFQITGEPLPVKGPFEVAGHLTAATLNHLKISDIAILLAESNINGDVVAILTAGKMPVEYLNRARPRPMKNPLKQERSKNLLRKRRALGVR